MKKYIGKKAIYLCLLMSMLLMTAFVRVNVHAETTQQTNTAVSGSSVQEDSQDDSSGGASDAELIYRIIRFRHFVFWITAGLLIVLIAFVLSSGSRKRKHAFQEYSPAADSAKETEEIAALAVNNVILIDFVRTDERYVLPKGQTVILGRSRTRCDLAFPEYRSMSSRQARIFFKDGKVFLENLDTMETTFLNGEVVRGAEELPNGSLLQLGDKKMKVRYE